ncbi:sperm flagellar protein 1-like [Parasteatoda tepidariorum]|uniref:sperm flagellar protein 1-like n=1 Tax=Parasteatoda tepidariorum TaxID=114398 RepID=UPI00077FA6FE|nr:sperm flagellar protein 1-like [Parasteatoda tepidariorum]
MNETEQVNLYEWLGTIPFSRVKKNLARDFSDGVLAAELIKHFYPTLVDLHNYPPTNTLERKKVNWATLNKKVLRKLAFPLSEATLNELAAANREAIEYFLSRLRTTIETNRKSNRIAKKKNIRDLIHSLKIEDTVIDVKGDHSEEKELIANGSLSRCKLSSNTVTVPGDTTQRKVQALLLEKQETIMNLTARVHHLEYLLLHKDHTINELRGLIKGCSHTNDSKEKGDGQNVKMKKDTFASN